MGRARASTTDRTQILHFHVQQEIRLTEAERKRKADRRSRMVTNFANSLAEKIV